MKPESLRMREWRDKHMKPCPECGTPIYPESKLCVPCTRKQQSLSVAENTTVGEYREKAAAKKGHPSWIHSSIRAAARYKYNPKSSYPCENCGYCKHTEVCHIRAISEWPDESLVVDINKPENILILCPNCHWEFDNCVLTMEQIKARV